MLAAAERTLLREAAMAEDLPATRWHARWIWSRPTPVTLKGTEPHVDLEAARSWVLFRRRLHVDTVPARVPARLTADSRYALWVNGQLVARGPVRGHPQLLRADVVDLTPWLVPGDNTLAVLARHFGQANAWWMPASPTYGLGGGAFVFEAALGNGELLVSDASWRCLEPPAWAVTRAGGIAGVAPEVCDGRALPAGWQLPDFDDVGWSAAIELGTQHVGWSGSHHPPSLPYGALRTRPIPQLGGGERAGRIVALGVGRDGGGAIDDDPVKQAARDERSVTSWERRDDTAVELVAGLHVVIVDFGEQVAGHVRVALDAPAGTTVDARAAEAVDADERLVPLQQHSGFRYQCRGHDDVFETFDPIGLRFLALAVRGAASLRAVVVREHLFPGRTVTAGAADAPSFACSDPLLDTIWRVGRRTVDLCSHDAYIDCPSREQRAWVGDSVVHQLVDLTTNGDWSLAAWNVELAAMPRADGMLPMAVAGDFASLDRTVIPDWALHWVHALWNLWRYTGATAQVARLAPVAERVLRWFEPFAGDHGLATDVEGWVIIDWAAVSTEGTGAALNALWARGLRDYAELADGLGDGRGARWARARFEAIRAGFDVFWDAPRGIYVDHVVDGVARRAVSQHTNAAAIAAGLVPSERYARILDAILDPTRVTLLSWLVPGREARLEGAGNMYADPTYLVVGMPEPWWDVERAIVAAQPFFRYVVHDAVAAVGEAARIPALCRDWQALLGRSATTWSETWFGGSYCHGWCATPTRDLMQYTLGVTPAVAGFERVRIAPALGDLAWARGAAPTPAGLVRVSVDRQRLEVETPLPAEVWAPGAAEATMLAPGVHRLAFE
jgi:hypothetical protein